jgi:RNA polymerase sigma factor (sigma-70 family)
MTSLSQIEPAKHCSPVVAQDPDLRESAADFETFFHQHYDRIARAVARIVGDTSCAEELAVEAFWKFWRTPQAHGESAGGWLYRTAINLGLYELRRRARHTRYQNLLHFRSPSTPEEIHAAAEEQTQVRCVLATMKPRDAELLLLRSNDLSYEELASALDLNAASVGTLIGRARTAFRKEYVKLYGEPRMGK